jgi:oligosaccharide repeat unit polymerase
MFRLSPYQAEFTTGATLFIGLSTTLSIIIPTIFLLARKKTNIEKIYLKDVTSKKYLIYDLNKHFYKNAISIDYCKIYIILLYVFVFLFFYENYLTFGSVFPLYSKYMEGSYFFEHYKGIYFINYINTILKLVVLFFCIDTIYKKKSNIHIFNLLLLSVIPLSRGQRSFSVYCILLLIFTLYYKQTNINKIFGKLKEKIKNSTKLKKLLLLVLLLFAIISTSIFIGNVRMGGDSYGKSIGLKTNTPLRNFWSWYYGYYPMSYDTFQRSYNYWVSNGEEKYYGLGLISGLYDLLKLDYVLHRDKRPYEIIMDQRVYFSNYAVLPTILHQALLDFGHTGGVLFIIIFSCYFSQLYFNFKKDSNYFLIYSFSIYLIMWFSLYSPFLTQHRTGALILLVSITIRYTLKKKKFLKFMRNRNYHTILNF